MRVGVLINLTDTVRYGMGEVSDGFKIVRQDKRLPVGERVTASATFRTQYEAERVLSDWITNERHD